MFSRRNRFLQKMLRYSVIVHTKDGRSIAGILHREAVDAIVLTAAAYLLPSGEREELQGHAVIERANVSFIQIEGTGALL